MWEKWGEWKRTSNHALLRSKSIEVLKLSYSQLLPSLGSWLGNKYIDEKNQSKTSIHSFLWHDSWPAYYLMASRRPEFTRHLLVVIQNHWISDQWAVIQQNWWCCRPWCRICSQFEWLVSFLCQDVGGLLEVAFHCFPVKIHVGYVRIWNLLESTTKALKPRMLLYHSPFIDQINGGWLWCDFNPQMLQHGSVAVVQDAVYLYLIIYIYISRCHLQARVYIYYIKQVYVYILHSMYLGKLSRPRLMSPMV